jgi:DNA-binding NtrC family response regulator
MLKAVAAQAAIAIETAQLIGGLQQRDALLVANTQLWQAVEGRCFQQLLLGNSPLIRQVMRLIEQLRDSSVEVLITGESGTGKELVARALHYTSQRGAWPVCRGQLRGAAIEFDRERTVWHRAGCGHRR